MAAAVAGLLLAACDSAETPDKSDKGKTGQNSSNSTQKNSAMKLAASNAKTKGKKLPTEKNAVSKGGGTSRQQHQPATKRTKLVQSTVKLQENIRAKILKDYEKGRWHRSHFKPAIDKASNELCLSCHEEILKHKPRKSSLVGISSERVLGWYQTLDTYVGKQESFHARHLTTSYAKQVMNLKCNFCHQGNDPREEAPGSNANDQNATGFTLRKMVNPSTTCLRCHGTFPYKNMVGLEGPWPKARKDLEDQETPNGCLSCHAETYRTVRHQVSYLNADTIEKLAKKSSDVCYGCHGGRAWYRINYPYPRTPWPNMKDVVEETPKWALKRPTHSEAKYRRKQ